MSGCKVYLLFADSEIGQVSVRDPDPSVYASVLLGRDDLDKSLYSDDFIVKASQILGSQLMAEHFSGVCYLSIYLQGM